MILIKKEILHDGGSGMAFCCFSWIENLEFKSLVYPANRTGFDKEKFWLMSYDEKIDGERLDRIKKQIEEKLNSGIAINA